MAKFVWVTGLRGPIPEVWFLDKPTRDGVPLVALQEHELPDHESDWTIEDLSNKYPLKGPEK